MAGLVVGWPTLDAGYLSGDDETLIFNHALVNHPSFAHAFKLFTIFHRDLYQPIPLLSFQIEFALHGGDVRLMHLANVLLHIVNGWLVWVLMRRLAGGRIVPLMTALLFVVHPLSVECLAWLNGRMMMLSTAFSLACVIVCDRWLHAGHDRRLGMGLAVVLLAALAMMSKVNPSLPILLLLLLALRRRRWPEKGWWMLWAAGTVLAVTFFVINIEATAESRMFEGAEKQLSGPIAARILLAWGWYLQHYLLPTGLSPYYPPPQHVSWADPEVLTALGWVIVATLAAAWSWRWTRIGAVGYAWFLAAAAPGLLAPLARNLLAADRYVYLANVGLGWIAASAFMLIFTKLYGGGIRLLLRYSVVAAMAAIIIVLAGLSRGVTAYYHDNDAQITRVMELFPAHPTLRTTWGWYRCDAGDYAHALRLAEEELDLFSDDSVAFYRAMNLRGWARYRLNGDVDGAVSDLRAAVARDPNFAKSYHRLGLVFYEQGRKEEAIEQLELAIEKAPDFNPALNLLAKLYRERGKLERAAELYEASVKSSRGYDVKAINALGEIEIERGQPERAAERYRTLLAWHEYDIPARINLALALRLQNLPGEAWEEYALLLRRSGTDRRVLMAAADFLRPQGRYDAARRMWERALRVEPQAADLLAWTALHRWYDGDAVGSEAAARAALQSDHDELIGQLVLIVVAAGRGQPEEVSARSEAIAERDIPAASRFFIDAFEALDFLSRLDDRSPWPYYVTTLLLCRRDQAAAEGMRKKFEARCEETYWRRRLAERCQN